MDLRRLRTFVTVADQGSVSKAAVHLRISQPGLSRQIQELQQELGLKLFERVGRRLVLTTEGQQLLGGSRSLLNQANSLNEQAELLKRSDSGTLKVAASPMQIETVLATFLPRYAARYPNVQVHLVEEVGDNTLAMIENGDIDVAIGLLDAAEADDRQFAIYPMRPLELMAACSPSFSLEPGSSIEIDRIASCPLLVSHLSFSARKTFDAICRLARIKPNIVMESHAHHTKLALAEAGLGIAIISSSVQTHRYRLRTIRLTYRRKPILEPIAVVWDNRRTLPRYARHFCESLAAHMRKVFPTAKLAAPKADGTVKRFRRRTRRKRSPYIRRQSTQVS